MKPIAKTALALLLLSGSVMPSFSHDKTQTCSGILSRDDDGFFLKPDSISKKGSLWCASTINADYPTPELGKKLVGLVLSKCELDNPCYIRGSFRGHGSFYWTNITSVKRVTSLNRACADELPGRLRITTICLTD